MRDDLVPRLRRSVAWQGVGPHGNELAREAADEITVLRFALTDYGENLQEMRGRVAALEAEIERLQSIINAKLHRRRCRDCGHVGWYADSRTPYCLCDQCRSQDTRRVKEAK